MVQLKICHFTQHNTFQSFDSVYRWDCVYGGDGFCCIIFKCSAWRARVCGGSRRDEALKETRAVWPSARTALRAPRSARPRPTSLDTPRPTQPLYHLYATAQSKHHDKLFVSIVTFQWCFTTVVVNIDCLSSRLNVTSPCDTYTHIFFYQSTSFTTLINYKYFCIQVVPISSIFTWCNVSQKRR